MDLDKLKKMAVSNLVDRHIHELQTAQDVDQIAQSAMRFRDELAEILSYDPNEKKKPSDWASDKAGLKMS